MRRPQQGHPYGPQGQPRRPIDLQGMTKAFDPVVSGFSNDLSLACRYSRPAWSRLGSERVAGKGHLCCASGIQYVRPQPRALVSARRPRALSRRSAESRLERIGERCPRTTATSARHGSGRRCRWRGRRSCGNGAATAMQPRDAPAPANDDRKSAIVTARRPGADSVDVPDMTPEEHRRRGDAADATVPRDGAPGPGKDRP